MRAWHFKAEIELLLRSGIDADALLGGTGFQVVRVDLVAAVRKTGWQFVVPVLVGNRKKGMRKDVDVSEHPTIGITLHPDEKLRRRKFDFIFVSFSEKGVIEFP